MEADANRLRKHLADLVARQAHAERVRDDRSAALFGSLSDRVREAVNGLGGESFCMTPHVGSTMRASSFAELTGEAVATDG